MKDNSSDKELFDQAMKGVTRLKSSSKVNHPHPHKKVSKQRQATPATTDKPLVLSDYIAQPVLQETRLFYADSSLQRTTIRKLKRGQMTIQATLDIHGYTIETARSAIIDFIKQAHIVGHRYLLIIHGKGYRAQTKHPRLKNLINVWLPQFQQVLAFCSALPKDGGTGAVYVLLRT